MRTGSYFPSLLEPRRRTEQALLAIVQQAYVEGVSIQKVDDLFVRNRLCHVPRGDQAMVAAALRTIFTQPSQEAARRQMRAVYEAMVTRWPKAADVLIDAENDILAYMIFPQEHWKRIYSNNILERLNKEVKRRTNVVGVFPDEPSVIRLVGAILQEQVDDWVVAKTIL